MTNDELIGMIGELPTQPPLPLQRRGIENANSLPLEGCPIENANSPPLEGCPKDGVVDGDEHRPPPPLDHPLPPPKEGNLRNTKNYMALPYNPALKERARKLRKAGNLSEVLFWNQVKNKQFKNYDFDRQKIIGNYIVDFFCTNCNVVVEIDGSSHDNKQEYDAVRDEYLKSLGLEVIHVTDIDIKNNLGAVMTMLYHHPALVCSMPRCQSQPPQDHPLPHPDHSLPPSDHPLPPPEEGNIYIAYLL